MSDVETPKKPCPNCGKDATGNFCQHCGTPLGGRFCTKCGAPLADGAKFCNQCGASRSAGVAGGGVPAATAAPKGGSGTPASRSGGARKGGGASKPLAQPSAASGNLPWFIAGGALFGLILVVGITMVRPEGPAPAPATAPAGNPAAGAAPDISNMTPREAADRLFDRVMRTLAANDTAGALAFQPMSVQAYQRAEPLDMDGVFHLAMLEMLTDPTAALASASRILEAEPNHVFALGISAQAHLALGDTAAARDTYQRLLANYEAEAGRQLEEYTAHSQLLDAYRQDAETFLNGG